MIYKIIGRWWLSQSPAPLPSQCHLISTNSGIVERDLLETMKDATSNHITWEILRVLRPLCQEHKVKTKYIFLFSLLNHNSTPWIHYIDIIYIYVTFPNYELNLKFPIMVLPV